MRRRASFQVLIHAHSGKDDISNHRINRDLSVRLRAENPMKRVSTRAAPREVDGDKGIQIACKRARLERERASVFLPLDHYVITDFPAILTVPRVKNQSENKEADGAKMNKTKTHVT